MKCPLKAYLGHKSERWLQLQGPRNGREVGGPAQVQNHLAGLREEGGVLTQQLSQLTSQVHAGLHANQPLRQTK
jgi:hypothetical protein